MREVYESAAKNEDIHPPEVTPSNVTMATPMAEGHSQPPTKYIKIDVESDDLEESKHELPAGEEYDFTDLPT